MQGKKSFVFYLKKMVELKCHYLIFLGVLAAVIKVGISFLLNVLIESFSSKDYYYFSSISLLLIFGAVILTILMYLKIKTAAKNRQNTELKFTEPFIDRINNVRGEVVDTKGVGEWMTILSSDIKDYATLFSSTIPEIIIGIISFIAALTYGLIKSPLLTAAILLISLFTILVTHILSKRLDNVRKEEQDLNEEVKQSILEVLSSVTLIRVFKAYLFGENQFKSNFNRYKRQHLKREKFSLFMVALSMGTGFVLTTSWIVVAFYLIINGKLTIADLLGFMLLDSYFNWMFSSLPLFITDAKIQKISGDRIYKYYSEMYDEKSIQLMPVSDWNEILLKDISFSYNENEDVIKNLSLKIKCGDKINIAGESGCGKSTLMKLINGFYKIKSGSIIIDGKELNSINELRNYISFVPQNNIIFPGTLKENICMGCDLDDDTMAQILNDTGLSDLVNTLDNGLDTQLDAGVNQNLSEGQIQRIGIARAIAQKSPIILLDEPTSALDPMNEKIISDFLEKTDKTILLVTHRKTSVPKNYKILNLINGTMQ